MNDVMQRPKAFSYVRFSTPEQARGDSYRRQTSAAEEYAAAHDLELDTSLALFDLGVSAFAGDNVRKGALGQFLSAIDNDEVPQGSYLLVENLDRVSRANPWDAFPLFQQIINAGVSIVTLQDQRVYTREDFRKNPMGILQSLFTMIRANEESETKSRRLRSVWDKKKKDAATDGKPMTRRCPAWLELSPDRNEYVPIPDRVEVIKRIFKDTDEGLGQHAIAHALNSEGVKPFGEGKRQAEFWHRTYVAKILRNPAVVGTFVPHRFREVGGKRVRDALDPIPDYFPVVVSKARYERVQERLKSGTTPRMRASKGEVSNILAGLAVCPVCGSTMTRVNKGTRGGKPYLVCTRAKTGAGCDYRQVKLAHVEGAILHAATRTLAHDVPSGDPGVDREIEGAQTRWDALSLEAYSLSEEIAKGNQSRTVRRRLADTEQAIAEVEAQLEALVAAASSSSLRSIQRRADNIRSTFEKSRSTITQKNLALRDAFTKCVVDYVSGGLYFHWKQGGETRVAYGLGEDDE